jgi:poly(A) polymerase
MLKIVKRLFSRGGKKAAGKNGKTAEAKTIARKSHGIARDKISPGALKVTQTLQAAGFKAYVVGGAVRDLLLGGVPKDYDVATSATPEEVHKLIRRSRIIGRRFRLVHCMFGRDTVEVATFRGTEADGGEDVPDDGAIQKDAHGRILRDNRFGNQAEDAARRDFTINSLFYDPATETVIDYHGGVADVRAKRIRIIGDPVERYREDPVRMLRAARFAARLGFTIDPATMAPIAKLAPLLENVPSSRLFEEMLKLLMSGRALECVRQLRSLGLHHGLLPLLDVILEQPLGERFVTLALEQTDTRIREEKSVSPAFLFAALLWHEVLAAWKARQAKGEREMTALFSAMDQVLDAQCEKLAITRKFTITMKEVWSLQPRFDNRTGKRPLKLLEHPRFRMGYDFLLLRAASGEAPAEAATWWEEFQFADPAARNAMLLPETGEGKKRRRRRRKSGAKSAGSSETAAESAPATAHDHDDDADGDE